MDSRNSPTVPSTPPARPMETTIAANEPFGAYVHFPYCLQKCPYCDFVSFKAARPTIPHETYASAVLKELERRSAEADSLSGRKLATLFFGGGTPSLWEPRELGRVLSAVLDRFGASADDVEITVECNPTSLDLDRAKALRAEGVNRLSVGVQALDKERLAFLGRLHSPDEGLRALEAALQSGVARVSGDLIFGVAGGRQVETADEAASEAERVASTGVTHVSAYALTIEPGTQFGELARKGRLPIAQDDLVVDTFFAIEAALGARGLAHYETSNYAVPGNEAQHNLGYWKGLDYLGLGCGAFGTLAKGDGSAVRYRNHTDPTRYMQASIDGSELTREIEPLDPETRLRERIMLGLRLEDGIDLVDAARALGIDPFTVERERALVRLERDGRIVRDGSRVRVPADRRALVDGIAAALF